MKGVDSRLPGWFRLVVVSVVRVEGRGLGVRLSDPVDGSSVILYPNQVRWLCSHKLLLGSVCQQALQALKQVSEQGEE